MSLTPEWKDRVEHWKRGIRSLLYRPIKPLPLKAFVTREQLRPEQAARKTFRPIAVGTKWGNRWQYGWFRTRVVVPKEAKGERVVLRLHVGEAAIYVNGRPAGARDHFHDVLTLSQRGRPGQVFDILAEAYAGHGPTPCGGGPVPLGTPAPSTTYTRPSVDACEVGVWDEDMFQLWMDVETLWLTREVMDPESLRLQEIDRGLKEMTLAVDLELPRERIRATARAGRRILRPLLACHNGSTAPMMYCFGHAHIDVAWLWPLRETEAKCTRTFSTALAMMKEYPEFRFLQSQPHLYWMVKQRYPKLYREIRKAVARGQWIAEGGMWVEADTNITSGESLIRQFLYGKRFFREEFGVDNRLLWLPDVFGYSGALPQIMKGCGVDYFSTHKIFWIYGGGHPFPFNSFWWEGIDGTRVFAHFHKDYNSRTWPSDLINRWRDRRQKDGLVSRLFPFGYGDGGGGATREHLEFLRREKDLEGVPRAIECHPVKYFTDDEKRPDWKPTYVGELYFQNHRGTYTSQARTKKGNRRCEIALRESEMWSAAASALGKKAYPAKALDALWRDLLLNQFHDILPGSSIARVYEEAEQQLTAAAAGARELADGASARLARKDAKTVTVFNSLSWERDALVSLPRGFRGAADAAGDPLPVQKIAGALFAEVRGIPSCGWTTLHSASAAPKTDGASASETTLENELLRVRLNGNGEITGLRDKEAGHELAAGPCNRFRMYKDVPNKFDAWDIDSSYKLSPVDIAGPAEVSVVARGPLVAALRVRKRLHDSTLEQEIRLQRGRRRIDFVTRIDWRERHKLLKVAFPVDIRSEEAIHEIQFGHLSRPTHASNQLDADRFEVCNQRWTALSENSHGVAILNDCKYGISVEENSINLTLLKSALAPDPGADQGVQEFTYSVYAWNGSFADSGVVREGYELNVPVRALPGRAEAASLFQVDSPNIVIEAVKCAEDGSGDIVVRLYESKRMRTKCRLKTTLPVKGAKTTNMLEQEGRAVAVRNGALALPFRPFEIKTVRLTLKG